MLNIKYAVALCSTTYFLDHIYISHSDKLP